jgi:hypothetical protein
MLMAADAPSSGKTQAMLVCAYLAANPQNTAGSAPAVISMMAEAHNRPELPTPCLYRDEVSEVFGRSGLNTASKDPIAMILREGYKRGAESQWSVNRVATKFSIYAAVIVAGNGASVPSDVRSRCLVTQMVRGRPLMDLDSDGAEDRVRDTGLALGAQVRKHMVEMKGFTMEGALPGLVGRVHQIYRPLLCVAKYVGGERWFKMAVAAYKDLTQNGGTTEILSADQRIVSDVVKLISGLEYEDSDFIGGKYLAEELCNLDRFEGRSVLSVARDISRALNLTTEQRHMPGGNPVRGYEVGAIRAVWERMKPAKPEEIAALEYEEYDPFAIQ